MKNIFTSHLQVHGLEETSRDLIAELNEYIYWIDLELQEEKSTPIYRRELKFERVLAKRIQETLGSSANLLTRARRVNTAKTRTK